jgi:signal transduction histidine kinase
VGNLATFWGASQVGYDGGIHHIYIVIIFATIVNMKPYNSPLFFAMIALPILLLGLLFLTDFSLFKSLHISQKIIESVSVFSLIINVLTALFVTYFFVKDNDQSSKVLENTASELSGRYSELQKLNTELDRFVYSVSHDLRAPITSSLGLTELMKHEKDINIIYEYAQLQEKSLKKLDSFIKDILDYSRNVRLELEVKIIDFQALINEIWEMQSFQPHYERIKKVVEIDQNMTFSTDEKRLSIILNNLISNALRYHNAHRENPLVQINIQVTEKQAIITLKDNGIGIKNEHVSKIFEMFYRATDTVNGSGLGLYIVREAVNKMQGRIEVQSIYGEGTTFFVYLPNIKS